MRLERKDDVILRPSLGGIRGALGIDDEILAIRNQPETVASHRFEMRPAGDDADLRSSSREASSQESRRSRPRRRCRFSSLRSGDEAELFGQPNALELAGSALRESLGE